MSSEETAQPTLDLDELSIRRAIMRMAVGSTIVLRVRPGAEYAAEICAKTFGRSRKIPLSTSVEPGAVAIKRLDGTTNPSIYPEIDALKVGESHVFALPPAMHPRIRAAATARNRTGKVRLACTGDIEHIRVTRLPLTPEEHAQCGPIEIERTRGKYELRRLLTPGAKVRYEIPVADHYSLRNTVSRFATVNGIRVRCRLQDDGSMLVYRVDEAPQAQTSEDARQ